MAQTVPQTRDCVCQHPQGQHPHLEACRICNNRDLCSRFVAARQLTSEDEQELQYRFGNYWGSDQHRPLSQAFLAVATEICLSIQHTRERASALTQLETASIWAHSALERQST